MREEKDFYQLEKEIVLLKEKIDELLSSEEPKDREKIPSLKQKIKTEWEKIHPRLTPLHIVQIARHPKRPYTLDYLAYLTVDFVEIHCDRRAGDDPTIVAASVSTGSAQWPLSGIRKDEQQSSAWTATSASRIRRATGKLSGS